MTYEHFNQLEGLSGGITSINNLLFGISAGIDGVTTGLFAHIDTIHEQQGFENLEEAVGVIGNSQTDIVTALSELHDRYVTQAAELTDDGEIPVSVATPDTIRTVKLALLANTTTQISTNADPLSSGVRVKVPSTATATNVFVGAAGVNAGNGYLLEAGDDVFIEVSTMSRVFVFATEAVDVYAIGS